MCMAQQPYPGQQGVAIFMFANFLCMSAACMLTGHVALLFQASARSSTSALEARCTGLRAMATCMSVGVAHA
jgi:hypothetical protein